jgi:hypothetical protein
LNTLFCNSSISRKASKKTARRLYQDDKNCRNGNREYT